MTTSAIVMAAGQGKRLRSDLPKVLHRAAGRPLLAHVLAAVRPLQLRDNVVVVSARGDEIGRAMDAAGFGDGITFVRQDPPRGTGDAVRAALQSLGNRMPRRVLVLPGDGPLITTETLEALLEAHESSSVAATVLTAEVETSTGYGRIVRDELDLVERIVEDPHPSQEDQPTHEINGGVYVFDCDPLLRVIDKVDRENLQGEYYLTDVIGLLRSEGNAVAALRAHPDEIAGANDRVQLAHVTDLLRRRVSERWMREGVTIVDPRTTYIDASVVIGRDVILHPFTFLEGATKIDDEAEIGPQVRIVDSSVGAQALVTFAVVRGSEIGPAASVGPYASLRPGTRLEQGARVGTFVETKQTTIGEGSKANHLTYLGDATIGRGVNIGAGTITCNWDGKQKHETVIEDDAYISSDTMLVAPVNIGKRAATGAGAVVRTDVPDDGLAVGVPARVIEGKGDRMKKGRQEP